MDHQQDNQEKNLDNIVFVFNDKWELRASRQAVAKSCQYFHTLLMGPFREAKQTRITIYAEDYPFHCFKSIIEYAQDKSSFDNKLSFVHYVDMIQLAAFWMFDDLVELVEILLIDFITIDRVVHLHTLANMLQLSKLLEQCLAFERILDYGGTISKNWGRCPLHGHEKHNYRSCPLRFDIKGSEEDWDRLPDDPLSSLSEEQANRLADYRFALSSYEYANNRRYFRRRWYK